MRNRTFLSLALAAFLVLVFSTSALAQTGAGTTRRGIPSAATWTLEERQDLTRISLLQSTALLNSLRELYRTAEGTYQSGCVSNGFTCAAGTGFDVNVGAGLCYLNYVTGATDDISAFRVLQIASAEAATAWAANPGANTYYVHVAPNDSRATDGYIISDPVYTIDTNANLAGTLTVCSIGVTGLEADATTYTITDLRTVLPGPSFNPGGYTAADLTATDDLAVGDDANVVDDLTVGAVGTSTGLWDGTSGAQRWGAAGAELGGLTAARLLWLGVVGAETFQVDGATGNVQATGNLDLGPLVASTFQAAATGAIRGGLVADPAWSFTAAGELALDGDILGGPTGADTYFINNDGSWRFGLVGAPTMTGSVAGAIWAAGGFSSGAAGADTWAVNAAGDQRWGAGAGTATMTAATGDFATSGTVDGLLLDAAAADVDYIGAVRYAKAHLVCTGGEVCDQADSPIEFGPTLPAGSMLMWCGVIVTTPITSDTMPANAAVVDIGIVGDTAGVAAAVPHTAGGSDGVPDWTGANAVTLVGAQRLVATVTVDNVADGILDVVCAIVMP